MPFLWTNHQRNQFPIDTKNVRSNRLTTIDSHPDRHDQRSNASKPLAKYIKCFLLINKIFPSSVQNPSSIKAPSWLPHHAPEHQNSLTVAISYVPYKSVPPTSVVSRVTSTITKFGCNKRERERDLPPYPHLHHRTEVLQHQLLSVP